MEIDYLVIGALTRDGDERGGWLPGGSGWFASKAVLRWGGRPAIASPLMSRHVVDCDPAIKITRTPSVHTATFFNRYQDGLRFQAIGGVPDVFPWAALPPAWCRAPIVHLAPLAGELDAIPPRQLFPNAMIGLTAQGWLRRWDSAGQISLQPWHPDAADLRQIDALVVSEEDIGGDEAMMQRWIGVGPIVALTRGERGVTVWHGDARHDILAVPTSVIDPTGAGDTWAAAFFWQLRAGAPVAEAAGWACAEAARAIGSQRA